jgi:hypothetical protein
MIVSLWKRFTEWFWFWVTSRPAICCTCRRIYISDFFWNPWWREPGQGQGKRLACSEKCCEKASPGSTAEGGP